MHGPLVPSAAPLCPRPRPRRATRGLGDVDGKKGGAGNPRLYSTTARLPPRLEMKTCPWCQLKCRRVECGRASALSSHVCRAHIKLTYGLLQSRPRSSRSVITNVVLKHSARPHHPTYYNKAQDNLTEIQSTIWITWPPGPAPLTQVKPLPAASGMDTPATEEGEGRQPKPPATLTVCLRLIMATKISYAGQVYWPLSSEM